MGGSRKGVEVPARLSIDLGVVDAFITNYGRAISFQGKGERTDVGERLDSPTQGMTISNDDINMDDYLIRQRKGVNRVAMRKKRPKRRGRGDFSDLTTVGRIR